MRAGHKPTVLVTGATGFVGSHIIEALSSRTSIRLIAACRDSAKLPTTSNIEIRVGDILDPAYLVDLFQDVDIICNAYAWTSAWGHTRLSRDLLLHPTLRLIDMARSAGVKRFINTSTTSAAAPGHSHDPDSVGIMRDYWPHLSNVVAIENYLRQHADNDFQVFNLRLGLFAGRRYGLGLLPMLLPRLKTHLVPWVNLGNTSMPIIDGRDVGEAFACAVLKAGLDSYEGFNIVGPVVPSAREVFQFLNRRWNYPLPHFSVPFALAYPFARVMELLDPIVPWEPLVTRSIVHLLEEVNVTNTKATNLLNYHPRFDWREAVALQMQEMQTAPKRFDNMAKPVV